MIERSRPHSYIIIHFIFLFFDVEEHLLLVEAYSSSSMITISKCEWFFPLVNAYQMTVYSLVHSNHYCIKEVSRTSIQ